MFILKNFNNFLIEKEKNDKVVKIKSQLIIQYQNQQNIFEFIF